MSRGKVRLDGKREMVAATVSPRTLARLDMMARVTGLSRGIILDAAIQSVDVCNECRGTGFTPYDDPSGERCPECAGYRVIPTEVRKA